MTLKSYFFLRWSAMFLFCFACLLPGLVLQLFMGLNEPLVGLPFFVGGIIYQSVTSRYRAKEL